MQIQELTEELEAARDKWGREQSRSKQTQRLHDEEGRGMSREIQELTAITEQLRSNFCYDSHAFAFLTAFECRRYLRGLAFY